MTAASTTTLPAIEKVWNAYQDWATYSRTADDAVSRWRKRVLGLSVSGAVLETLSGVLSQVDPKTAALWARTLSQSNNVIIFGEEFSFVGLLGAVFLMSAAYLSKEIIGGEQQEARIQARAVAEGLKSEAYLYAMKVGPYDDVNADANLLAKWEVLEESMAHVSAEPQPSQRKRKVPQQGMTADEYVTQRLDSQIHETDGYYWKSVRKNNQSVRRFRYVGLFLAWFSALLGMLVAAGVDDLAAWVAVITTISGTIAAFFQAGRYEQLSLSYATTARRLTHAHARWQARTPGANAARDAADLAQSCEAILASENQGWMAQWFQGDGSPAVGRSQTQTQPNDDGDDSQA